MSTTTNSKGEATNKTWNSRPTLIRCLYEFGPFRVDPKNYTLTKGDSEIGLPRKAFDLLLLLIQHVDQVIDREELLEILWSETIVEEANLTQTIYLLRKSLGPENKFIETVPKRGYRFKAEVREVPVMQNGADVYNHALHDEEIETSSRLKSIPQVIKTQAFFAQSQPTPRRIPAIVWGGFVVALSLAAFLIYHFQIRDRGAAVQYRVKTLAILPFRDVSASDQNVYFGLGLTDALITKLSNYKQIVVRPTSAVYHYVDQPDDSLSFGRALEVDAVLEGTIQKVDDRIRVTVRLVNVSDGQSLWGDQFVENFANALAVQDNVAEQIIRRLPLGLSDQALPPTKRQTNNADAYEAYMRGIYFWNKRNEEGYRKSIEYFEEAIRQDPNYSLAYAALADSQVLVGIYDYDTILPRGEAFSRAKENVLKALALDDTSAEAYTTLAAVKGIYDRDIPAARDALETALTLNPNYPTAHHRYGIALQDYNPEKGLKHLQAAQNLDPVSCQINADLATAYYYQHDYDRMIKYSRKALETNPNSHFALLNLGIALSQKGEYEEALVNLEKARQLTSYGDQVAILQAIGYIHAVSGNRKKALDIIDELSHGGPSLAQVIVYVGLGEKDRALDLLQQVFDLRRAPDGPSMFCNDPRFDMVRRDPRFKSLMSHYRLQT